MSREGGSVTGSNRLTTGRQVPRSMFIDPELARIGLRKYRGENSATS